MALRMAASLLSRSTSVGGASAAAVGRAGVALELGRARLGWAGGEGTAAGFRLGPERFKRRIVGGDRFGKLLDQGGDLAELGGDRRGGGPRGLGRAAALALDSGKAAADLGDLTGQVAGAAGQVGDLVADVGAVTQPARYRIVECQRGEHGHGDDGRFGAAQPERQIEDRAAGAGDQHHAYGDEYGAQPHHE